MTDELARPSPQALSALPPEGRMGAVLEHLFAGKSEETVRGYRGDLERFATWLGEPDSVHATIRLFGLSRGDANYAVLSYRKALLDAGQRPTSINRALAAIRMLCKVGRLLGQIDWALDVVDVPFELTPRPGPPLEEVRRLLQVAQEAAAEGGAKAVRDYAILRLLTDLALRRGSVCSLQLANVDRRTHTIRVRLKGKRELEPFTLPEPTREALYRWLDQRGPTPGAVFYGLDPGSRGPAQALTGRSVLRIVDELAQTHPHAFRHAAITALLKRTGNLHAAMHLARHTDPRTTMRYDDSKRETADQAARDLTAIYAEPQPKKGAAE